MGSRRYYNMWNGEEIRRSPFAWRQLNKCVLIGRSTEPFPHDLFATIAQLAGRMWLHPPLQLCARIPFFRPFRVNGWMCFQFLRNYLRWWIQVVECEWHLVTRNVHSASSAFALSLQNAHQGTTQNLRRHIFSFATCEKPVSQWMKWSRTQFSRRSERLERREVFDSEWNRKIQADIGRRLVLEYLVSNMCENRCCPPHSRWL